MFNLLWYNIKNGFTHLVRSKGMSLASLFSIVAMMLILGVFFTITTNLNLFTVQVEHDYDEVEIYLLKNTSMDDVKKLISDIESKDGVESVKYRSADTALEILKSRWGESGYLLDSLDENPLPASLVITVTSLEKSAEIAEYCGKLPGTDDVQYYKETVEKLTKVTNALQNSALIVMAFLIIICVVVVSNTVKITVAAREKEIQLMKYIGATNWFIRGPFMTEGIILGLLSALIGSGLIYSLYSLFVEKFGAQIISITQCPLITPEYMITNVVIIFVAIGFSIGAWGSLLSMRKYLDA